MFLMTSVMEVMFSDFVSVILLPLLVTEEGRVGQSGVELASILTLI